MDDFTPEALEQARILFARPATFVMGCAKIEQLPDPDLPEVARRWAQARSSGASRILMMGAHLLRAGTNRQIIDLIERGAEILIRGGAR